MNKVGIIPRIPNDMTIPNFYKQYKIGSSNRNNPAWYLRNVDRK